MIDRDQFRLVIDETLAAFADFNFHSKASVRLLMATAAQESNFCTFLFQKGVTPYLGGIGFFQVEGFTDWDNWANYLVYRPRLMERVISVTGICEPSRRALATNIRYQVVSARLRYIRSPGSIPEYHDVRGMAEYWDSYYNRNQSKGTANQFISNVIRYNI